MKNSIRVPIHSIVDVITNSSTTIYTSASDGAEKGLEEIINKILSAAGSTKTASELFAFQSVPNEQYFDQWNDCEYSESLSQEEADDFGDLPWKERETVARAAFQKLVDDPTLPRPANWGRTSGGMSCMDVVITARNNNKESLSLLKDFGRLIDSEEAYE